MQKLHVFLGHQSSVELYSVERVALREGIVCKAPEQPLHPPHRALQGTQPVAADCNMWLVLGMICQQSLLLSWWNGCCEGRGVVSERLKQKGMSLQHLGVYGRRTEGAGSVLNSVCTNPGSCFDGVWREKNLLGLPWAHPAPLPE